MIRISPVPEIKIPMVSVSRVLSSTKSNTCPPEKANAPSDGIKTKPKADHRHDDIMKKMILMRTDVPILFDLFRSPLFMVPLVHYVQSLEGRRALQVNFNNWRLLIDNNQKPCAADVAMHVPCKLLSPTGSTIHFPHWSIREHHGKHDKVKTAASHLFN